MGPWPHTPIDKHSQNFLGIWGKREREEEREREKERKKEIERYGEKERVQERKNWLNCDGNIDTEMDTHSHI